MKRASHDRDAAVLLVERMRLVEGAPCWKKREFSHWNTRGPEMAADGA